MHRTLAFALALAFSVTTHAATFTVNNTGDAGDQTPGNGACATAGGVCTLRAAIQEANALAGADTIHFSIGSGLQTIAPATDLPAITQQLTIDATTQPGGGIAPRILLDGANARTVGLDDSSVTLTVRGLAIGGFTTAGIRTLQSGDAVTIESCYIGVAPDGVTAMPNADGIRAIISDLNGSTLIVGNTSGGGNVISGNLDMGIELTDNGGTGAKLGTLTLQGNIMGLGADGMTAVPNLSGGIRTNLQFGTITVGGSAAGRNIISGNGGGGYITQAFFQADTFIFSHNYVGVAQDGSTARGNGGNGASLVGRTYTVDSNIFASNSGAGVILATGNQPGTLRGNRIGVALDGSARGNTGSGIRVASGFGVVIGGAGADQNLIANNGDGGIVLTGSGEAEIAENSVVSNTGLGIDLGDDGVTANDALDADTQGGNNTQNSPTISSALRSGGITFVNGTLSAAASTTYRIRFYASATPDPSGFGEGETYLGLTNVTTNGSGNGSFSFSGPLGLVGTYVTATATNVANGNTSEFSNALVISAPAQFRFSAANGVVPESGIITLTIERNNSVGTASVSWATVAGTATTTDFMAASGSVNFANGQITRTIDITITPDAIDEYDESFTVVLSNPVNGEIGSPSFETITITDDDAPPSVSLADNAANEGNSGNTPLTFTATLSAASQKTITVDYLTSSGTAIAGSDYSAATGTLTFAPGQTVKSLVVQLVGDTATELDEAFNVTLANPVDVTIADGTAIGTITNDDGPPAISVSDVAVIEGDAGTSTALFTLALSGPTAATVSVNWSTSNGTAAAGSDYESGSGIVTFAPNTTTATIAVTIDGDTLIEDNETFFVDLSGPTNATLADAQGGGTIADDDGTPTLSINDPAVVEGVAATFTVTLAPASTLPVSVTWATSDGTAIAGSDYAAATNTLTFAAGETTKTISIATSADAIAESAEQFTIALSSPSGAAIGDGTGTATILDDDGPPRVTIGNASIAEGNAGSSTMTFTVDLSHASASAIAIDWNTADATATGGSDYTAASGTIAFAPGETSKTIDVAINGDAVIEPGETFFVQLTGATNATITDASGTGTIDNDDGAATIAISNASANEGTGGATTLSFDVTLSAPASQSVSVPWATADGTATAGSDYTAASGSLVFAPGDTSKSIVIAINPDAVFEPNETFSIDLLGATNATILDSQGTGTIVNDDSAPVVPSVSVAAAAIAEGNSGTASLTFTVTLDAPTTSIVTVNYATSNGSATIADYVATSGTLTFNPGVTTQTIVVPVLGDVVIEGNETLTLTLSAPSNATLGTASATGTILDDDIAPAVPSISIADASATEGNAGSAPLAFVVQLSVPTTATVHVNYATSNGSATIADYVATSGTLTFDPGVTTQTIVVPVLGDIAIEGNETLTITLSAPSNATIGTATATGTIVDDDIAPAVPSISIADASVAEGNAGSAPLAFVVQLSVPTTATVHVNYATSNGSATAGTDYVATNGTLTFNPGVTTQTIAVPVLGDVAVEGNETLTITLSAPSNATLANNAATGTILDDDSSPTIPAITIGDVSRDEGDSGATLFVFPVTLSAASSAAVSVNWTTVSGSAVAGHDFLAMNGTLVFAPGMTRQTIAIAVNGDTDVENDETFSIQLGSALATGTIRNDDRRVPELRASGVRVDESSGEAVVTLTLSARASGASVRWMTRGGTATGGADFTESSGRVVFGSSTTATIAVPILSDALDEADETFAVELFDADGATLRDERVEITIVDDDETAPQRSLVLAVGSLRGNAGSRFGTAVQLVNAGDAAAAGALLIHPAGTSDTAHDVTIDYALGPHELHAFGDLLAEHGLEGLATLDVIPSAGATPQLTVRIYDDGSGHGTTGFTLPTVTPSDALAAGDGGLLIAPDNPIAMRFNIGIRTLDAGATIAIEIRDRAGAVRHATTREFPPNWFNQVPAGDFAGVPLASGDYIAIRILRGSAILYGAAVDNLTNDPSVQVVTK